MISRRSFTRLATLGVGAAAAGLPISLAQTPRQTLARLSSNENPWGPSPAALKAIMDQLSLANRYPDEHDVVRARAA